MAFRRGGLGCTGFGLFGVLGYGFGLWFVGCLFGELCELGLREALGLV